MSVNWPAAHSVHSATQPPQRNSKIKRKRYKMSPLKQLILIVLALSSCASENSDSKNRQTFEGRTSGLPVYQAKIFEDWVPVVKEGEAYTTDTTLPIASFLIGGDIKLTIHNFPTQFIEERVPTQAQVTRWLKQFEKLNKDSVSITATSHGGFAGVILEASGLMKGEAVAVLAVAMQLATPHYHALSFVPAKEKEFREMRSDFTIKAMGPIESLQKKRAEILEFARSFELIKEIPTPS